MRYVVRPPAIWARISVGVRVKALIRARPAIWACQDAARATRGRRAVNFWCLLTVGRGDALYPEAVGAADGIPERLCDAGPGLP